MSDTNDLALDNCGCCEPKPVPSPIYNRPGLPALSYRAGIYGTFLRRMINRIGAYALPDGDNEGQRPLAALSTRGLDDASMALLDASAVVADVLTFYQERMANEGFLRTSNERYSILELARAIGYELSPGVAASTYLAFTVEDAAGAPGVATVPAGTQVKSIPPQGKLPQTFETSAPITVRKEWNELKPRTSRPQLVDGFSTQIYLEGTATRLQPGQYILVVDKSGKPELKQVYAVVVETGKNRTCVKLAPSPSPAKAVEDDFQPVALEPEMDFPFIDEYIQKYLINASWDDEDLNTFLTLTGWNVAQVQEYVSNFHVPSEGSFVAFRSTVGFYGNNAPLYASMPKKKSDDNKVDYPGENWDSNYGLPIWYEQLNANSYYQAADVFLERTVQGIIPNSWVCIQVQQIMGAMGIYKISFTTERSLASFGMSSKVTGLVLYKTDGNLLNDNDTDKPKGMTIRNSVIHLLSEELPLAYVPVDSELKAGTDHIELDTLILGLHAGQPVILSGQRADADGLDSIEVLFIKEIKHAAGFTKLAFTSGLKSAYKLETVSLNANLAPATHGETISEPLGSGDGAKQNQRFTLKKPPLTHVAAPTPSGLASTLELRVNNLLWDQANSLYPLGTKDEKYIARIGDDGKATIMFGDGSHGTRLPTGQNNITAKYRSGIGLDGQVDSDALSLLATRPLGVRGVTNPLPATGAADPETIDNARGNAPLTVRTLDRIVSLADYEDFARAFAGIGKAQAVDLWNGETHLVHVTIAAADGSQVDNESSLYENLIKAINASRDQAQIVQVDGFEKMLFSLKVNIAVEKPKYIVKDVFEAIGTALKDAFAFKNRAFGQMVTTAEVMATIQDIPGVVSVDIDSLYLSTESAEYNTLLPAQIARVKDGKIKKAQHLLINPIGITLTEVQP